MDGKEVIWKTGLKITGAALSNSASSKHAYQVEVNRHQAQIDSERKRGVYDQLSRILYKLQKNRLLSMDKATLESLTRLKVPIHRFASKKTARIYEELIQLLKIRREEYEKRCKEAEESCSELQIITDYNTHRVIHEDFGIQSADAESRYRDLCKSIKDDCSLKDEEIDSLIARLGSAEQNDH